MSAERARDTSFTRMQDATREDYAIIGRRSLDFASRLPERILERLQKGNGGRTMLVATHRLSAVRYADLILVLQDGEVRERGTHEELLLDNGLYARAWRLQREAAALEAEPEHPDDDGGDQR